MSASMHAVLNVVTNTVAQAYVLTGYSDRTLLDDVATLLAGDRATTAVLLAHLAEVDARRLYLPAACPSTYVYCVRELGLSEDSAFKRIRAARTARRFPVLFTALAEGRLHLSGVVLLAPYLTLANAGELLAATARRSKSEIEELLARRFPRSEMLAWVEDLAFQSPPALTNELAPGPVEAPTPLAPGKADPDPRQHSPGNVGVDTSPLSPERVATRDPRSRITSLSPQRFALQVMIGQATRDKLRHAQALLSHRVPSGDLAEVLDRALDALIAGLEKRKFAATARPRRAEGSAAPGQRYVPAAVKRAVWARDGGRCTFSSNTGVRCPSRTLLEFDHVDPVARGGRSTVAGLRLRCRAHNQYEAERAFGTEFMRRKREEARWAAEAARAGRTAVEARARRVAEAERSRAAEDEARQRAEEAERAAAEARAQAVAAAQEVVPWLRALGIRAEEACRAAALCESIPDAPLEERVRVALRGFRPRAHVTGRARGSVASGP